MNNDKTGRISSFLMVLLAVTAVALLLIHPSNAFVPAQRRPPYNSFLSVAKDIDNDISAKEALKRTASHLKKLERQDEQKRGASAINDVDAHAQERAELYQSYIACSANSLKQDLKRLGLPRNGRKPDLAKRLVDYEMESKYRVTTEEDLAMEQGMEQPWKSTSDEDDNSLPVYHFARLTLSKAAGRAIGKANFATPSPIQAAAIPALARGESAILHAETGSGKTLAYILPITEQLWKEQDDEAAGFAVILTPTRELAAQVAGIASVLAPPGSVQLVFRPTNLMADSVKEHGIDEYGSYLQDGNSNDRNAVDTTPRLIVGSAKAIMHSLYGDGKMPASPTTKPEAMFFLRNVRWLVLDEVDRLLHVKKSRGEERFKRHERPASVIASAVARMTLGRAQIVAASATVGRPLKRELSRVLGLAAQDCPQVIRGQEDRHDESKDATHSRAVTIPTTVRNYVTAVDGSTSGQLLTFAFGVIKELSKTKKKRKMLLVLTRGCGMSTKTAVGALKHFQCRPEPTSLLDALEATGSSRMIEAHRRVSGAAGVGQSTSSYFTAEQEQEDNDEYLFVTGEDTIRGLHLDGLDVVIIVGRAHGPDEYTHIAGRTGRAGKVGNVISVVSQDNLAALQSWERMLNVDFQRLDMQDIANQL